ncbi:LysM peptidoglycan-binding domain-containing protein [Acinetobacter sp. ACIN00229]|uniref:glycoside hydrolase family protein n=1 Tax=Acinetobacter sp. ACIN00229 TaxID=2792607 RepID=UPI0018DF3DC7|nr:LysM peptidoglycan-binding domain-containing protein [Acinetobacter sp. ACIN00229]MBI0422383.1 LysM peptidoglycan-binding domain-containing protein [Acinetobacter sp. ACIN00229]
MKNKCLVTFILLDLLGHPIKNAKYQIKNGNNLIAEGLTNSKGAIVDISRDKGVVLDVYFQNILNQMQLISRVCLEKSHAIVKLYSPSVLIKTQLREKGKTGQYSRKTYKVKKGDTLLKISKDTNCKIEEIQRINKIKDANKISEGQILKLPLNKVSNGEPKKINNSSNINNGVAKKDNHDDKDDHWFGTLAKAPDWMPDISADKIYNHIKDQILNSTAPELKNMNAESQDTGNPKQNISNYKPSIIFPFKVKPINDIGGELSNYYWGAKLNDTNASMAIFGRNRSGNRKHAGRDLYSNCKPVSKAESGFEVVAIAPGKVIASQGFYLQTNQVSIRHKTDDGREFVIRYGELDPKSITLKVGDPVKQGQILGKTGVMKNKNGPAAIPISGKTAHNVSMLHFEYFTGNGFSLDDASNLTIKEHGLYSRRDDVADPLAILLEGYRNSFDLQLPQTTSQKSIGNRIPLNTLTTSANARLFIQEWEGKYLTTDGQGTYYYDDSKGYCTVGWGHLVGQSSCKALGKKALKDFISISQAKIYFEEDVLKHEAYVKKAIKVPLYQYEFDALVSLAFNIGNIASKAPNLCKLINESNYKDGPKEMLDINKITVNGKKVPDLGLTKRRNSEYQLFIKGTYDARH